MVSPTTSSVTPKARASLTAELTTHSDPRTSSTNPNRQKNTAATVLVKSRFLSEPKSPPLPIETRAIPAEPEGPPRLDKRPG